MTAHCAYAKTSLCVCVQGVTLCSVSGVSDDHSEGPGEAGWLGPYLHHLPAQWDHGEPGISDGSALQT